jgi:hypothetical protein
MKFAFKLDFRYVLTYVGTESYSTVIYYAKCQCLNFR